MALPIEFENPSPIELIITEAEVEAGDLIPSGGRHGNSESIPFTDEGEPIRKIQFTAKLINQSPYPITALNLVILNPTFFPDDPMAMVLARIRVPVKGSAERGIRNHLIKPQEVFDFLAAFYIRERKNDLELINHLSDFRLRVFGIYYESESSTDDEWWDEHGPDFSQKDSIAKSIAGPDGLMTVIKYVHPKTV